MLDNENLETTEQTENEFSQFSIDDLIRSTREEIEKVEQMMGENSTNQDVSCDNMDDSEPGTQSSVNLDSTQMFQPVVPELSTDVSEEAQESYGRDNDEPAFDEEEEEIPQREPLPAGIKALLYVCCVLAASVILAIGAWKCADDVLALTKPDETVVVTVEDGATINDVTAMLKENGLISYDWLFKFYCWFSHAENTIVPGTYELNSIYDYHALVYGMAAASEDRSTTMVTIPEGYECKDIFALLAENNVCSVEKLEDAAANYHFEYEFLEGLEYGSSNRLEGYLFPDTYEFYVDDHAENVIDKFLRNFDSKVTDDMYEALDVLNKTLSAKMRMNEFTPEEIENKQLTMHDIITVASLVEKETARTSESASISSVIYNRLCSKLYPCLQIDATIQYVLDERKETLSNEDLQIISPYNTYKNAGLPAGPIACPGINSIRAALYPADTNYYFYALNKDGVHHFSETSYEHQEFLTELEEGE